MLYSYNKEYPKELPFRITLSNGTKRTDPTSYSMEEIQDAGYVAVSDPPELGQYDTLHWNGTDWYVTSLSDEEINALNYIPPVDIQTTIVNAVQERLDGFARTRNYDGILSACSYVNSSITRFAQDAKFCMDLRDNTWMKLYQILEEVENGSRPQPMHYTEIEQELPILEWATESPEVPEPQIGDSI